MKRPAWRCPASTPAPGCGPQPRSYFTGNLLDALAAAAVDVSRGWNGSKVEKLLAITHGRDVRHRVQEVQMTTVHTLHFMSRVPAKPGCLTVLVTTRQANVGVAGPHCAWHGRKIARMCP
jgi:hypothetical protein